MINEIRLSNLRYKVVYIEPGNIREIKKRLVFQHGISENGEYVNLCGAFKLGKGCYALSRDRREPIEKTYTRDELVILLKLLNISGKVDNPKFTEILVRGISDKNLTRLFYDDIKSDLFKEHVAFLIPNPEKYEKGEMHVSSYDRQKYSVYQLMKDLAEDHSRICIDPEIIDYEKISTGHGKRTEEDLYAEIVSVQGNKNRANLSLLYRLDSSERAYSSMCLVRDGAIHTKTIVVIVNSSRLRRKLIGARVVSGTSLFKNELILNLTKIPIIGKKFLKITERDYFSSCIDLMVQEKGYEFALHWHPEERKPKKSGISIKKPESTTTYTSYCLEGKTKEKIEIENRASRLGDFDVETRRKSLEKARKRKRDMTFRYLMSKREKFWCSYNVDGVYMSMQISKKTIKSSEY